MINGDKYVVEDASVEDVRDLLSSEDFVTIPGIGGREDFVINSIAVSSIFAAYDRERD